MATLAFILGREPELSIAEIAAVLGDAADWAKAALSREVLVVPIVKTVDAPALMVRLGGSVKIGEVWCSVTRGKTSGVDGKTPDVEERVHEAIGKFILEHTSDARKVCFGYSVYDLGAGAKRTAAIRQALARGAAAQKAWLQERGRKVRGVTSREVTLSSVVVAKNDLLPERNGVEVLVLVAADHIILARTLAVQPFEEWGARDFGRPKRDARSGMLPPKLARIMLNIAKKGSGPFSVLDPFCGSGTVLTEAMAFGVERIIGTDVSAEAIRDATANVAWAGERLATRHEATMTTCDVRKLSPCVRERVDAIVTEPYLGPPNPTPRSIPKLLEELHALYVDAFREFAKVLQHGGQVVFVIPVFLSGHSPIRASTRTVRQEIAVDITRDVEPLGFRRIAPFPPALASHPMLRDAARLSYARPDQRVGRHIILFERT